MNEVEALALLEQEFSKVHPDGSWHYHPGSYEIRAVMEAFRLGREKSGESAS